MTLILKQSTSIDIRIGPAMDPSDGITPVTGLTIAGADQAEVLKFDGAATVAMTGTLADVTDAAGWYDYTVATGDVDTVGEVVFVLQDTSLTVPMFVRGQVVEEAVYDALYAASAEGPLQGTTAGNKLDVNATGEAGLDMDNTSGTIAAAQIATDAITAAKVATDAITKIANAMLPKINTALADIYFVMVDETDGLTLEPSLTVTVTKSLDGGTTFTSTTGSVTEVADGVYSFDADAADMNGAMVMFKMAATGAANTYVTIRTSA